VGLLPHPLYFPLRYNCQRFFKQECWSNKDYVLHGKCWKAEQMLKNAFSQLWNFMYFYSEQLKFCSTQLLINFTVHFCVWSWKIPGLLCQYAVISRIKPWGKRCPRELFFFHPSYKIVIFKTNFENCAVRFVLLRRFLIPFDRNIIHCYVWYDKESRVCRKYSTAQLLCYTWLDHCNKQWK